MNIMRFIGDTKRFVAGYGCATAYIPVRRHFITNVPLLFFSASSPCMITVFPSIFADGKNRRPPRINRWMDELKKQVEV